MQTNKEKFQMLQAELDLLCKKLVLLIENQDQPDSNESQKLVQKHYKWLCNFWQPDKESYSAHAEYRVLGDLKSFYNTYHPQLSEFLAHAIKVYAYTNLRTHQKIVF